LSVMTRSIQGTHAWRNRILRADAGTEAIGGLSDDRLGRKVPKPVDGHPSMG
jgi:hypothetical protein